MHNWAPKWLAGAMARYGWLATMITVLGALVALAVVLTQGQGIFVLYQGF